MKRFFYTGIAALLLGTASAGYAASSEKTGGVELKAKTPRYGALKVSGSELKSETGQDAVLHGVSMGWHNWWPRFYNEEALRRLHREWKADVVRAAIGVEPDGALLSNRSEAMRCAETAIETAIKEGFYVIVDWHSHGLRLQEAKDFFTGIARKYGRYPHVLYEIYNEPVDQSWPEVKAYAEEVTRTIRAVDPDNIILVGSPHWDQDIHLAADDPLTGVENILYTFHFYAASHKQYLRDRVLYARSKGLPLFASECAAMEATGDGPINYEEWEKWEKLMKDEKLSWVVWSIADKEETCSMFRAHASSTGPWKNDDLKEWGRYVRSRLAKMPK